MREALERHLPEGIPYPGTRAYAWIANHSPFMKRMHRELAQKVAERIACGRILDVGTGPGYFPIEIARLIRNVTVIGIDLSRDMIRMAKENARRAALEDRVTFEVEDANKVSYPDSSFDLVVSTGSFHHWKDQVRVLNEIHRILRPGCEAWIFEIRRDVPNEDYEKLRKKHEPFIDRVAHRIIVIHSGATREDLEDILRKPDVKFKTYEIIAPNRLILGSILHKA
jgi:ubiquinone/menaquinone biosynthesis C-methylase UbiE